MSQKQKNGLPAYFKGGTALYKALKKTNRFSEDIDLSVDVRDCPSRTKQDKILEAATKKYTSLTRNSNEGFTNRSAIESIYEYDSIVDFDKNDALQRFGRIKIEATSFTISEPVTEITVTPLIYDYADEQERISLKEKYNIEPFTVKSMTISRMFIDKIFAMEAYIRRSDDPAKIIEAARHMYDLTILSKHQEVVNLYNDYDQLKYLLEIRLQEEQRRLDGIKGIKPKDFLSFKEIKNNKLIMESYLEMEQIYILSNKDKIPYSPVVETLHRIQINLLQNKAWFDCELIAKQ